MKMIGTRNSSHCRPQWNFPGFGNRAGKSSPQHTYRTPQLTPYPLYTVSSHLLKSQLMHRGSWPAQNLSGGVEP